MAVEDLEEENLALVVGEVVERKVALGLKRIGGKIAALVAQSNILAALDYGRKDVAL